MILMIMIVPKKIKKAGFHEYEGESDQMKSLRLESPQIRNPSESSRPEMKLERIFLTINDLSVIFLNQQMLTIMSMTDRIILIVALCR